MTDVTGGMVRADDLLDEIVKRLVGAKDRLMKMERQPGQTANYTARLHGKVQGVELALSYIGEERSHTGRKEGT